jgi:hypothetical protein
MSIDKEQSSFPLLGQLRVTHQIRVRLKKSILNCSTVSNGELVMESIELQRYQS